MKSFNIGRLSRVYLPFSWCGLVAPLTEVHHVASIWHLHEHVSTRSTSASPLFHLVSLLTAVRPMLRIAMAKPLSLELEAKKQRKREDYPYV